MGSSTCLKNIEAKPSPGNHYCPGTTCQDLQPDINTYCKSHNMGPDEPYATFANDGSGKCYCCCSCFAFGTPIEVSPELYKLIQGITVDDTVLATGPDVAAWSPATVTFTGGIAAEVEVDFMILGQFQLEKGSEVRLLIASADHLFLNADPAGPVLVAYSALRPGHRVRTADGATATVVLTSYIQFKGGVRHIGLGPWEPGQPLDGHLINSNGLVTADLSVQMAYYSGSIPPEMVLTAEELPAIGSVEFHAKYDTSAYTEFVNDPSKWPAGCRPLHPELINIPRSALGYFTPEQARDIQASLGQQNLGNSMFLTQALYLFNIYGGFYKDITFIADWSSLESNAWWFVNNRQRYIVVAGGLLRVPGLMLEGMAIVLSHLVANNRGVSCTADADWEGVRNELREVWYDNLFFQTFEGGMPQLESVFARIEPDHRGGNPDQLCADPGIDCRIQALWAGASLTKLPECAVPPPAFAVTGATASPVPQGTIVSGNLWNVVVTFNKPYNHPSAADPGNYVFAPGGTTRQVGEGTPESVSLVVEGLNPDTACTVTVSNVYSGNGKPLTPGFDSAKFTTPPEVGS